MMNTESNDSNIISDPEPKLNHGFNEINENLHYYQQIENSRREVKIQMMSLTLEILRTEHWNNKDGVLQCFADIIKNSFTSIIENKNLDVNQILGIFIFFFFQFSFCSKFIFWIRKSLIRTLELYVFRLLKAI